MFFRKFTSKKGNCNSWFRKKRKRNCKSWYQKTMGFSVLPHPLKNFEIQKYYQNEPRFNDAFSGDNLPKKIKDGTYVINLDEYVDVGTHWIALIFNRNEAIYFDNFGIEHIHEEIKEFVGNKNIKAIIFRVQGNHSVMCGYFCIELVHFMLAGKKLTDYTSLFSPHVFKRNDNIILDLFQK